MFFSDLVKYWGYGVSSAGAQLESEVSNSYLNWLWWILEPLCMMCVYAFIFGTVFGMETEGYHVFIFIGIMFYDFFSKGIKSSVKIIRRNRNVVTRTYVPKFILVMSELFVGGFKMLVCLAVSTVMGMLCGIRPTPCILMMVPIMADMYLFTFAACIFAAHFGTFVEDLQNVVNIMLKFLFYFTGVFYSISERLPVRYSAPLLRFYPVAGLIENARNACMHGEMPNIPYLAAVAAVSVLAAAAGIRLMYRHENTYVKML